MGSSVQELVMSSLEIAAYNLELKQLPADIFCPSRSGLDMSKFYNTHEIYRVDLAPTSVSTANLCSTGERVAIKKIFKSYLVNDFQRKQAIQECLLTYSLDHKNIAKGLEWTEDDTEYSIVLEYIDQPNYFHEKIDTNLSPVKNEDKLRSYIRDVLEALVYLHSQGIIHGDIKLENMLLKSNDGQERRIPTVKLCDFGLSRIIDKNTGKAFMEFPVGTAHYMAPEIKAKAYVDEKIDMWALGVVLYKMAVAYKPTQITGYKYVNGPIPFRKIDWRKRTPELQDLIVRMLAMDPTERISAEEALRHPWFRN